MNGCIDESLYPADWVPLRSQSRSVTPHIWCSWGCATSINGAFHAAYCPGLGFRLVCVINFLIQHNHFLLIVYLGRSNND